MARKSPLDAKVLPLGFCSYVDYLNSALWASIRSRVYEAKGRVCLECKEATATEIHHRRYDEGTLKGLTLNYLIPICDPCHERIHGINRAKRIKQSTTKKSAAKLKRERKAERKKQRAASRRDRGEWAAPTPAPGSPQPEPSRCSKCQGRVKATKLNKLTGLCAGCEWELKRVEIKAHNQAIAETKQKLTKSQKRRRNSDRRNFCLFKKTVECRVCLRNFTTSVADSHLLCERCRTRDSISRQLASR